LKGFRVVHLNIASLVKHVDELKIYLEKEPLDVLSINETRLDETISTDTVSIPGYYMVAKNRNRQAGGVAIYHRSILNVIDRDDLVPEDVEAVFLEIIKAKSKPVLIASAYTTSQARIISARPLRNYPGVGWSRDSQNVGFFI
jgi:exonuclease III